eukprot:584071-Amorphochlora_amoeboformis.AAC.1
MGDGSGYSCSTLHHFGHFDQFCARRPPGAAYRAVQQLTKIRMDRILVAVAIGLLAAAAHKEGPIELRPVFRENKAGAVIGGRVPLSSHQKVGTIAPAYHYGKYEPNCESGFQYFGDPYANASTMGNIVLSSETINPGMSGYQGVCVVMIYDMNSNENRKGFQIDWTSDCSISV